MHVFGKKKVTAVNRRAQTAQGLIGLITLLLIFYIIFLPPEERKALLEEEAAPGVPGGVPGLGKTLFHANPGRLAYLGQDHFDHLIPSLLLTEERQAKVLAEANPFIITKGWFRRNFKNMSFVLDDPGIVDNVFVSFQAPVHRGRLSIVLNGVQVFNSYVTARNPQPIQVPRSLFKQSNMIEFQVWGFGLIFSREYDLEDVKVIGEILDVRKQQAANSFSVAQQEHDNIESGTLAYYPVCDQNAVGLLDITLNDKVITSAVPVCDSPARQELFKEDLRIGKNTLGFKLHSGAARLEQVGIRTRVKPVKGFSDFFFIPPDIANAIITGKARAILDIEFVDDGRPKEAQLNINGRLDVLSQRGPSFVRDISVVIKDDNNFIGILPMTDLNVMSVDVRVE
jgi:hypothetical protein